MGGDVEDVRIIPEERLGAVPVMDVPVDDEDPLPGVDQVGGGHRHIVEEAESHGPVTEGVVAGGPSGDEGDSGAALAELIHRGDPGSGRPPGGIPGGGIGVGIRIQMAAPSGTEALELVEIVGGVDPGQLGRVGRLGGDGSKIAPEMEIADPGHHRVDAGRPLGMLTQLVGLGPGGSGDDELGSGDAAFSHRLAGST